VALHALVMRLRERGYLLLDTQWTTPHLEQFGAQEIPLTLYRRLLAKCMKRECAFVD
jgi:leucyl/phenylalanyl-tRNA---protein transferase